MYTKSLGYMKASLAVLLTFLLGIITTALVAKAYDQAAINTRAQKMVDAIKTNASKLDPVQVQPYYALVILNLRSLSMVLAEVDKQLATAADTSVLAGLLPPANSGTNNTNNNTNTNNSNTNNNTNTAPQCKETPYPNGSVYIECVHPDGSRSAAWRDTLPNANTGSTTPNTQTGSTTPNTNTGSTSGSGETRPPRGPGSCQGTRPTGEGIRYMEYSESSIGPSAGNNYTWMHESEVPKNYMKTCSWSCMPGFTVNADKTSCEKKRP